MFEIVGLSIRYPTRVVFADLSLVIGPEPTAIVGPSGSGKTTLLQVLSGRRSPDRGTVTLDGREIENRGVNRSDSRVAYMEQDFQLVDFLTVEENLRLAREVRGLGASSERISNALGLVGLKAEAGGRMPRTLSGGEQQRVALARAIVCECRVLIADEPTGALDAENTRLVTDVMLSVAGETNMQLVVATHDPAVSAAMASTCVLRDASSELAAP